MNTANLFLTSILLSVFNFNDNNNTNHSGVIDYYNGRVIPVADVTKIDLHYVGNKSISSFAYHSPRLIIKSASLPLDFNTSDNHHNGKEQSLENKYATLPENNHSKRKKRKKEFGIRIPNGKEVKNMHPDFFCHEYNKVKRKVIV